MEQDVIRILAKYTEKGVSGITMESSLQSDLKLNSLDVVNLIVEFEDQYDISISDEEIMEIVRVKDIMDCLEKKCNHK